MGPRVGPLAHFVNYNMPQSREADYRGLKAIAVIEFIKGCLALAVAIWFLSTLGDDWGKAVENLLSTHVPSVSLSTRWINFFEIFDRKYQSIVAIGLLVYAVLHIVEAVGLWHRLYWAEWLGVISGGVYIPFEVYEMIFHPSWVAAGIFCINLTVVGYLIMVIKNNPRRQKAVS